jgi:hypothetical protein
MQLRYAINPVVKTDLLYKFRSSFFTSVLWDIESYHSYEATTYR